MSSQPEPLSWLTLERYALGELSTEERVEVEARLAQSDADRACLVEIMQDKSELPPLPALAVQAPARRRSRGMVVYAGLCAAAAALFLVLRPERGLPPQAAPYDGVKGTQVALRLISEGQGADPEIFRAGERFKVEVTCPPRLGASLRLFVFQGRERFEPLPKPATFACGNLVAWPGAFALDGQEAADVCVYWGVQDAPHARAALGRDAVCTHLEPR